MGAVDIVIVNWNSGEQLAACIASVRAHEGDRVASIVVVDNASADGSADALDPRLGAVVIRSNCNLGFGRACNLGAARGSAEFVLLLNPDTQLTEPAIGKAAAFLDSAAGRTFGICGVRHVDEHGRTARHCARFPGAATFLTEGSGLTRLWPALFPPLHLTGFDHRTSRPVDHVMGAFYLIRRSLWERLGGCDERFFVYLEDLDLSLRAARAGAPSYYLADASIFHRGGGTSAQAVSRALSYGLRSRRAYARKHLGRVGRWLTALDTVAIYPGALAVRALARGSIADIGKVAQAWRLSWRDPNRPGSRR